MWLVARLFDGVDGRLSEQGAGSGYRKCRPARLAGELNASGSHQELRVWKLGMEVVGRSPTDVRSAQSELHALMSQNRHSGAGIPANIAGEYGRGHRGEHLQFLRIANGSLKELETHPLLSVQVDLCSSELVQPVLQQSDDLGRMLLGLVRSLESGPREAAPGVVKEIADGGYLISASEDGE